MIGCRGIVAKYSRLLCDCNRKLDSPTLFRTIADGKEIQLNKEVTPEDRDQRLQLLYYPYHTAIDEELQRHPAKLVFSLHSFTPEYEGSKRKVEVGLLFSGDPELATSVSPFSFVIQKDERVLETLKLLWPYLSFPIPSFTSLFVFIFLLF